MAVSGVGENRTTEAVGSVKQETTATAAKTQTAQNTTNEQIPAAVNNLPDIQTDLKRYELNQKLAQTEPQTPPNRLGNLTEGDRVPVSIGETTTQTDVLRAAYTEFGKRAGLDSPEDFAARMVTDGSLIYHQGTNTPYTAAEFETARQNGALNIVPQASDMTALRQARLEELTSYSLLDWSVTTAEQQQAVSILKNDPNLSQTVGRLETNGSLRNLIDRVDDTAARRELVDLLGRNLDQPTAEIVRPHIERLDVRDTFVAAPGGTIPATDVSNNLWQVRFNMARLGITPTNTNFDPSRFSDLIGANTAPFSGVGATGVNPTTIGVPLGDQWGLLTGDEATVRNYSNPLGNLNTYLNSLSPQDRARQAELLLNRPVSTTMPDVFGPTLPSRADVIRAAANRYNLQPELVSAFILAEQRDQTRNEDGKDYTAATSIRQGNTSIGLGQVVVSTAQRNNLFSDLISERTQRGMRHNQVASLLADDTANIFAVAKYIRQVADRAQSATPEVRRRFETYYPGIDFNRFREHSSNWSLTNIQALGSEYTSSDWDVSDPNKTPPFTDSPHWGRFVGEAYQDVIRSGVYR